MLDKFRAACDHARLVVRREPHGLGLIELRVLKGGQPEKPIQHSWRQTLTFYVNKIRANDLNGLWQRSFDRSLLSFAGRRQSPRVLRFLIVSDAHPDANEVAFALSFSNDFLRGVDRHSSDRRKELPLVWIRAEVGVNEYAVVLLPRHPL